MNQSLTRWADLLAIISAVVLALVLAVFYARKNRGLLRPVALFFLVFGPAVVGVHMVFHLFFTAYVAIGKAPGGSFAYDFRFYSLNLMGVLLGVLSYQMLRHSLELFTGKAKSRTRWLASCGWIVLVSAPTIPFTFIGSLPVQAVLVSLIASCFVRRKNAVIEVGTNYVLHAEKVAEPAVA